MPCRAWRLHKLYNIIEPWLHYITLHSFIEPEGFFDRRALTFLWPIRWTYYLAECRPSPCQSILVHPTTRLWMCLGWWIRGIHPDPRSDVPRLSRTWSSWASSPIVHPIASRPQLPDQSWVLGYPMLNRPCIHPIRNGAMIDSRSGCTHGQNRRGPRGSPIAEFPPRWIFQTLQKSTSWAQRIRGVTVSMKVRGPRSDSFQDGSAVQAVKSVWKVEAWP